MCAYKLKRTNKFLFFQPVAFTSYLFTTAIGFYSTIMAANDTLVNETLNDDVG